MSSGKREKIEPGTCIKRVKKRTWGYRNDATISGMAILGSGAAATNQVWSLCASFYYPSIVKPSSPSLP